MMKLRLYKWKMFGVRFNGSMPGDKKDAAVIPLTAYNNNTITVNADNLPQSVGINRKRKSM